MKRFKKRAKTGSECGRSQVGIDPRTQSRPNLGEIHLVMLFCCKLPERERRILVYEVFFGGKFVTHTFTSPHSSLLDAEPPPISCTHAGRVPFIGIGGRTLTVTHECACSPSYACECGSPMTVRHTPSPPYGLLMRIRQMIDVYGNSVCGSCYSL